MKKIISFYQAILDRPFIGIFLALLMVAVMGILFREPSPELQLQKVTQYILIKTRDNQSLTSQQICKLQTWYQSLDIKKYGGARSFGLFDINKYQLKDQAVESTPLLGNDCNDNEAFLNTITNPLWNRLWTNPKGSDLVIQIQPLDNSKVKISQLKNNFNSIVLEPSLEFISFNTDPMSHVSFRKPFELLQQFFIFCALLLLPIFIFRRHILVSLTGFLLLLLANLLGYLVYEKLLAIYFEPNFFFTFSFAIGVLLANLLNLRWLFLSTHSTDFHLHNHYKKSFHSELWFKVAFIPLLLLSSVVLGWSISVPILLGYGIIEILLLIVNRICLPAIVDLLPGMRSFQNQSAISFFTQYRLYKIPIQPRISVVTVTWLFSVIIAFGTLEFSLSSLSNKDRFNQYLLNTRGWNMSIPLEVHQTQDEVSVMETLRELESIPGVTYVENPFAITEATVRTLGSGFRTAAKQKELTQPSSHWFYSQPYSIETRIYIENLSLHALRQSISAIRNACSGAQCSIKHRQFEQLALLSRADSTLLPLLLIAIVYLGFAFFLIFHKSAWIARLSLLILSTLPWAISSLFLSISSGSLSILLWPLTIFGLAWGMIEIFAIGSRIREKNSAYISSYAGCIFLSFSMFFVDLNLGFQSMVIILPLLYSSFLISTTMDSTIQRLSWGSRLEF